MVVSERMSSPVVTVPTDTDFQTALALMQRRKLRRLPVVDGKGALVGIVAERDLLLAATRFLQSRVEVSDIMKKRVVTIPPGSLLKDAARLMLENKVGGLPVVEDGVLVGMITESDIFRRFTELQS